MTHIHERLGWALAALVSLAVLAALAGLVSAGPLDPTGPPGSTGKNVITSLPFTINQPGSYVLNSNLSMSTSGNAITVATNDVTIDMQGFELTGVSPAQRGIQGFSNTNLTIRNGTIRGFTIIALMTGTGALIENVNAIANGRGMSVGYRSTIRNCLVESSTADYGISAGTGVTVDNCRSEGNNLGSGTAYGIQVGDDSVITNSVARYNGGTEILTGDGAVLENCVANGADSPGNGIQVGGRSVIRGCSASNNGGDEITAGDQSEIVDCLADGGPTPAGNGIVISNDTLLRGCTAVRNANGIWATGSRNRIEANHSSNDTGNEFKVDGFQNIGIQNDAASGGSNNYSVAAGHFNQFEVISSTTGATNPFANVSE